MNNKKHSIRKEYLLWKLSNENILGKTKDIKPLISESEIHYKVPSERLKEIKGGD